MSIHPSVAGQNLMKTQLPSLAICVYQSAGPQWEGLQHCQGGPEANILGLRGGYLVTWNYVDFPCLF